MVDNHTIDDTLRREGWDVTKRSMRGQGPVTVRQLAGVLARGQLVTSTMYMSSYGFQNPQAAGLGHGDMRPWLVVTPGT